MSGTRLSKKHRKHGRFKLKCDNYRRSHRREKNKLRRLNNHLRKHGSDRQAVHCAANLAKLVG